MILEKPINYKSPNAPRTAMVPYKSPILPYGAKKGNVGEEAWLRAKSRAYTNKRGTTMKLRSTLSNPNMIVDVGATRLAHLTGQRGFMGQRRTYTVPWGTRMVAKVMAQIKKLKN
jgi:hypothetical protein